MGNDISVFSEAELESSFWAVHGPKDETTYQWVKRSWRNYQNKLKTQRASYGFESLTEGIIYGGEVEALPGLIDCYVSPNL